MSTQATQEEKLWAQSILHTDERLLEALYVRRHEGRKKPEPRLLVVGQYQILLKKNKTKGVRVGAGQWLHCPFVVPVVRGLYVSWMPRGSACRCPVWVDSDAFAIPTLFFLSSRAHASGQIGRLLL